MDESETIEQSAVRAAKDETGFDVTPSNLLGVYSPPTRDPRGRTVNSIVFSRLQAASLKPIQTQKRF